MNEAKYDFVSEFSRNSVNFHRFRRVQFRLVLAKKEGISITSLINQQLAKAKQDGRELTREQAQEEMIADACETMLADGSLINKLSSLKNENRGLWSAIKQFFENLFNKIDKLYRGLKPDSAEGKYIADMRKTAKELKDMFAEGLILASENKTSDKIKKTALESTVDDNIDDKSKKSSRKDIHNDAVEKYHKRLDAWDGKTEGFSFVMGDTPSFLAEIEVNDKKIGKKQVRIDATKVKNIMKNHAEMSMDVIKNLPYLLNDPIVVLDSKTVSGRLVLLGEVYANNKPVMMALEINPSTRSGNSTYVDVIKVASAYTRSNTQNMINSSKIRFVSKNEDRVNDWLKVNRLQLPLPNSQSNSVINSISQTEQNVNSKKMENIKLSARSKNMSTGQIEKLKANYTHEKVYSKKSALNIISRFNSVSDLKGKTREEIASSILEGLNGCKSIEERNTFSRDMAEYYVSRILREGRIKNPESEKARETLTYLQSGIQKIAFSEEDIIEINHLRDSKGLRSIQSRWGYKKDSRGKIKLRYPVMYKWADYTFSFYINGRGTASFIISDLSQTLEYMREKFNPEKKLNNAKHRIVGLQAKCTQNIKKTFKNIENAR